MSENSHRHMVMPAQPRANHVVTHPQTILAISDGRFYRPTHPRNAGQLDMRDVVRSIAEVDLQFRFLAQGASQHQPDFRARQSISRRYHTTKGKFGHHRSLAAFLDQIGLPLVRRDRCGDFIDPLRQRGTLNQSLFGWFSSTTTPRGTAVWGRRCQTNVS